MILPDWRIPQGLLQNKDFWRSIIFTTLFSLCLTNVIACILFYLIHFQEWRLGIFCACVIPLIVAPLGTFRIYVLSYELTKAKEKIELLANTDDLTGIFNRRYFLELAQREYFGAERYQYPICLGILDIDHFKQINDRYGHPTGDEIIKEVCTIFKDTLRKVDMIGRYGGDEFLVLLPHTEAAQGMFVFNRLQQNLEKKSFSHKDTKIGLTLSVGFVCTDGKQNDVNKLIDLADKSLYKAKESGRNRVVAAHEV